MDSSMDSGIAFPLAHAAIPIGAGVEVSRFIVGHNPLCGGSHTSQAMDLDMRGYFDEANVVKLYRQAEALGMRTLRSAGLPHVGWLEMYRRAGGVIGHHFADRQRDVRCVWQIPCAGGGWVPGDLPPRHADR